MEDSEKQEFLVYMNSVARMFNYGKMDPELLRMYWLVWKVRFNSMADLRVGMEWWMHKSSSMPKPADLRHTFTSEWSSTEKSSKSPKMLARLAWDQVMDALHEHGRYRSVIFEDKATMWALKHIGGWLAVLDMETKREEKELRDEFVKFWVSYDPERDLPPGVFHGTHGAGAPVKQIGSVRNLPAPKKLPAISAPSETPQLAPAPYGYLEDGVTPDKPASKDALKKIHENLLRKMSMNGQ